MKIKTKLTISFGLLLGLITILGVVGGKYIFSLKSDTDNILRNNYMTLEYSRNMLAALDQLPEGKATTLFENNLRKQEHNLTEPGENELTGGLRIKFESFLKNSTDANLKLQVRENILKIIDLNMHAIQKKNKIAQKTAENAFFWISITAVLCFLTAMLVLLNFPSQIADPIRKLTESIRQITSKNYSQRLYFERKSEFGLLAETFNTMAEKLQEYESSSLSKILFEKKRIDTLINNMSDPVIGLDEQEKVIFINQQALKVLNLDEKDCMNHSAGELSSSNDLMKALALDLDETSADGSSKRQALKIFADKKESYFEEEILPISITPGGESEPRLVGHVIILRNVTKYKEVDFAKTNFIATVSHELKTPISSIKMSVQLLENKHIGHLNEEQGELLDSILEDANRLLNITGELLNITQIESGNIQLSILPVDVRELLAYAISTLKTQADQKHIRFEIDCPASTSKIQADSEKTAWVLTNLVSNAVRYSYENSTIHLSVKEVGGKVEISVKDTGMGIAPEYRDKIFNRYFRIPGTQKEGHGLGLSISKEFIEAQGGEIRVESEVGEGSTFTVSLNQQAVKQA
ncbi:MAG: PAS domain-containing sensor histidine kinase [Bacteroidales bacterium 45-6]|nr:MAG: PAS domain-containing sensor histidine kinase [Bacteroidales bacterium 45-6]